MNRLSKEKSAYLKHAATQKIDWYPWTEEAFERAREEDKPLFLSSGAVWCHWCHVMAKESFYNDEIASILNEKFISIKLDRDARPDIDRRYQMSVNLMGSGGGWPLSVFMTHDKRPFFGGTYFPPDDRQGRPGFRKVLLAVAELYKSKRDEITKYSNNLMDALKPSPAAKGEISESLTTEIMKSITSNYDSQSGGFGNAPKFPMFGAMEFLIEKYYLDRDKKTGEMINKSLQSMACGGFYDQVGGGFHRYSTDREWIIPHFEKMADDNAWLLRNYLNAYAVTGNDFFREIAEGTIRFIKEVLLDPSGGFYASQDADVTPDDEGGYFTWTDDDFKEVLNEEEYKVLSLYLMHERGSMHHDQSKRVLFVSMGAKEIAEETGMTIEKIMKIVESGKEKLLVQRNSREIPFIDNTLFTSINGMIISVFILASRILKDDTLKTTALKSLDRIMELRFINGNLFHTDDINALLDDYIYIIDALLSAYEITGDKMYFDRAEELMNICINKLWDDKTGGFFDSEEGLLDINIKAIEDVPHPSANSLAVKVFLKFYSITGRKDYHRYAEMILELFIEQVKLTGIHSGYYFCALNNYFNMLKLTINTAPGSDLARAAIDIYSPFSNIVYGEDKGQVIPCMKDTCFAPVKSPEELISFFKEQKLSHNYHKESEAQLMGDYSVSEVVEQAVQTEKLGYDFYTQISQKFTDNEGLKNLFDTLAVKEQQHEVTFRALKDKVADQKFENWEEAGKYMKSIVESEFFLGNDKSLLSLEHIKSVEDAVKFAIGFEKETLLYFYHLKDALNDKDTIDEIIKEEQSHIVWLSDFRKTL